MDSVPVVGKGMIKWAVLIALVVLAFGGCSYVVGTKNMGAQKDAGMKAQFDQNRNSLSQYSLKVAEACQVPDMYKNDLKEIISASMTGRYGAEGSKATFQFLKEHEIPFDSSLYTKIQQMIDAGRTQFEAEQKLLLDKKAQYEALLGTTPRGDVLNFLGFPKVPLSTYVIVTSGYADKAFSTGKEEGLTLRPKVEPVKK